MKKITHSEKETIALAKTMAKRALGGEVYTLSGDLGAGKTVFARGFALGLGIKRNINSPTFVLMKIYPVKNNPTIKHLCHIDAYRLKSARDLAAIGAGDYLGDQDSVCLIEWPEKVKGSLTKRKKTIKIAHLGKERRMVEIK